MNENIDKTQNPKQKPAKHGKFMLVRYSHLQTMGFFEHQQAQLPKIPTKVVVKTERGLELGELIGQLAIYKDGNIKFSTENLRDYFQQSEIDNTCESQGKFIRFATAEDLGEQRHLETIAREELQLCQKYANELNLEMKIVDAEHIFGGERVIFYFMSEGRIDFRDLVKKIARQQQTRIEMRQIGPRDEARLLGDLETCGQQCCCQRFLQVLKPVNMRMAKVQKATLDPSKISGYCGRLKCCLRYEDQTYSKLKKQLPRKNTRVRVGDTEGNVIDGQILTQLVLIECDDGNRISVPADEIEIIASPDKNRPNPSKKPDPKADSGNNNDKKNDHDDDTNEDQ